MTEMLGVLTELSRAKDVTSELEEFQRLIARLEEDPGGVPSRLEALAIDILLGADGAKRDAEFVDGVRALTGKRVLGTLAKAFPTMLVMGPEVSESDFALHDASPSNFKVEGQSLQPARAARNSA